MTVLSDHLRPGRFSTPVVPAQVAADWSARGFGCNPFTDPPGQQWLGFVHDTNELVTVVQGKIAVTVSGQTVVLQPGDEIFIPRNAEHDVINCHDDVSVWLFGYDAGGT
ncbi:MAG: cupin domain-containing protein [Rhodospirillales bacterium]